MCRLILHRLTAAATEADLFVSCGQRRLGEMVDAHFGKDQAEGHRQDNQEGRHSVAGYLHEEFSRRLLIQHDDVDHSRGHAKDKYSGK